MTEANPVVLVVDDEVQIRRFLRAGLELDGFTVQDAETGADALRWATLKPPDLVILDLGLPDMDGAEVLERLRAWSSVPLIVLSVRSNEAEKVRLLESGADDYVVKPFGMAELLARAHAAMRRHVRVSSGEPVVRVGPLAIDLPARIVTINGARVMLTPKEYRLLQLLAQHAGNVVTHQFLLKEVWGSPHLHDTHYLRIFVRKLRQKIEADPTQPRILLTELGVGYRLVVPEPAAAASCGVEDSRGRCRGLGALPPPLAGEGWGGGCMHGSCCGPPPCPSPASGGGDAEPTSAVFGDKTHGHGVASRRAYPTVAAQRRLEGGAARRIVELGIVVGERLRSAPRARSRTPGRPASAHGRPAARNWRARRNRAPAHSRPRAPWRRTRPSVLGIGWPPLAS